MVTLQHKEDKDMPIWGALEDGEDGFYGRSVFVRVHVGGPFHSLPFYVCVVKVGC